MFGVFLREASYYFVDRDSFHWENIVGELVLFTIWGAAIFLISHIRKRAEAHVTAPVSPQVQRIVDAMHTESTEENK